MSIGGPHEVLPSHGFEVYASDRARRGAIVAAALIANSSVRLREADWLPALRPDDLRANGAAAVSVFTLAQARRIDGLLTAAAARQAPTRALLELLAIKLVCRLFPMSLPNATDAARAAAEEYDTISPRRLGHYLRRDRWIQPAGLRTLATAINGGVIGGRGHATQRDAREAIAASTAAVIYLDPPYPGTTGYGAYGLLDTLLGDDLPAAPAPRLADLLDAAVAAPIVVLSYGGPGVTLTDRDRPRRDSMNQVSIKPGAVHFMIEPCNPLRLGCAASMLYYWLSFDKGITTGG